MPMPSSLYSPVGHGSQCCVAFAWWPASQDVVLTHATELVEPRGAFWPMSHGRHSDAAVAPRSDWYVLSGQSVQALREIWPGVSEYVPGSQRTHGAPGVGLYVPRGHGAHFPAVALNSAPAAHGSHSLRSAEGTFSPAHGAQLSLPTAPAVVLCVPAGHFSHAVAFT